MALQTKTISDNGAKGHHKFTLTVTENSTSTASNTSSLSFSFQLSPVQTSWKWEQWVTSISYSVNVNGSVYSGYIPNYDGYSTVTLKSGSLSVAHSSDGSKSISISFSVTDGAGQRYTPGNASASSSMTLTKIPRQATISSAPDFNDEQNPTITYSNAAGNSVDSLAACISFTGAADDIPYRSISKTGTSYTFSLTENERNILRNSIPNSNSRSVIFYVRTVISGATYYSTLTRTLTIVNGTPTFSANNLGYYDSNSAITAITGNNAMIVRNKSNLMVTYTAATAKKGASISQYSFTVNDVTKTSTSAGGTINFGTINSANNLTLSAKVTDSRGNVSGTVSKTIACYDHSAPYFISFDAYRANADGTVNSNGTYLRCIYTPKYSSVNNTNGITVKAYYTTGTTTKSAIGSNGVVLVNLNEESKTYQVHLQIVDNYSVIGTSSVITVFGSSRILNITQDGTGVAVGMLAEQSELFDVRWKSQFRDDVVIKGDLIASGVQRVTEFYTGSTSGTITKTLVAGDSVDNYKYLEIFYTDNYNNGHNSVKVSSPNGRQVDLSLIEVADNTPTRTFIRRTMYTIVGDGNVLTITPSSTARGYVQIDGTTVTRTETNQNYIKIIKVLGYK